MTALTTSSRTEHDLLGDRDVPADAYWGVHTLRATENFPITGTPISTYPHLIDALAAVKEAAALANGELGLLEPTKAAVIVAACQEIRGGELHDQFVVDVIQGGAGTSTNMNANEVIANRALELLGHSRGSTDTCTPTRTSTSASPPTTSTQPPCGSRPSSRCAVSSTPWPSCRTPSPARPPSSTMS